MIMIQHVNAIFSYKGSKVGYENIRNNVPSIGTTEEIIHNSRS